MAGVELMVGGWVASPVIKIVFDKAQKYLGVNYKWDRGGKEMVDELTRTLLPCKATVEEVEKREIINNQALADWLKMLKETVYEAEDVLDNIETKSIKDEVEGKTKNQVSKLACYSLSAVRNMVLSDKNHKSLKKVVDRLKELRAEIPTILELAKMNVKNKKSQTREDTNPRETISQSSEEVGLYGREEELNLILEIILGSPSKSILEKILGSQSKSSKKGEKNYVYHGIHVIPIVGMGGVGKTALAQAVYNHPEVQQTFESRAWISVSKNHNGVLLVRKIIESLKSTYSFYHSLIGRISPMRDPDAITLDVASTMLSSTIGVHKFIFVFDDISESQWDVIYTTLSHGAPGSVVLITTQNQEFADRVGTFCTIALSALDPGKFWELFELFAFGNKVMSVQKRSTLKSIGKKIADKLGGLPLAAKIIGNILRSKVDEVTWRDISKSEWWDIPKAKSQILPSVGIGYEQLDPCLRQCFAYCSLFPRNSLIEKDRLVHMWIAQNFIIQSDVRGVKTLEDIGRQCFDELVKKSLFQRAGDNNSYVMHDLIHDLAVIVSSDEYFYLGEGVDRIPSSVRHLAVDTNNLEVIREIQNHKNLRSFLYFGCFIVEGMYSAINDTLSNLGSIRVLDLSYMWMEYNSESPPAWNYNSEPPPAIWNLQHLRFLDLSSTEINVLTYGSSINLYHLQALYIRKCYFKELPRGINKLINLCQLCAEEETIAQISGIGQLTNLQELSVFVVGRKKGHRITELRDLREIRGTLRIKKFGNIKNKDEAMQAKLVNKKHLDSIHIIANHTERNSNEDMEVLQELQPNKDIKDLRIHSYAGLDFPKNWIIQIGDRFPNLNTLCLVSCVNVKVLPPFGELPSLRSLQVENCDSVEFIDSHLYGKNQTVFPLLEELVLDRLSNCEVWTDGGAGEFFPRLSKLTIENNRTLREAPLHLFSSTLKKLKIRECSSLISLGNSMPNLSSITHLEFKSIDVSISLDPLNMPLLEDLNLWDCPKLKIKGDLQPLTHLKHLRLVSCSQLFSTYSTRDQQKGKGLQVHQDAGLRSLTHIEADHCSLLNHEYHLILGSLPSLQVLKFSGITQFTNNNNLWFKELTALKEIRFTDCEFEHLPASLTQLSALKKMALLMCGRLQSLSDSMPPNLQKLYLEDCSQNLVLLCKAYEGQDLQFIFFIPVIHIDDYTHRKDKVPRDAAKMTSMEIQKPQISDAIGLQACASCGKTFEQRDLVLRSWEY